MPSMKVRPRIGWLSLSPEHLVQTGLGSSFGSRNSGETPEIDAVLFADVDERADLAVLIHLLPDSGGTRLARGGLADDERACGEAEHQPQFTRMMHLYRHTGDSDSNSGFVVI